MKSKTKKQLLTKLAAHLKWFKPNLENHFVCPTCLDQIPINRLDKISVAHIIPKSTGGDLTTFICKKCNSIFGHKQDRWFGDVLDIMNSNSPEPYVSKAKGVQFEMSGVKVNGDLRYNNDNGGFELLIDVSRNNPDTVKVDIKNGKPEYSGKLMDAIHQRNNSKSIRRFIDLNYNEKPIKPTPIGHISMKFPFLSKENSIDAGFLTAAYLMWFRLFGYSWVFQKNLDIVRKQIHNPEDKIIPFNYCIKHKFESVPLWCGFIPIGDAMVPAMGISNGIVILPQRNIKNFYR